MSNKGEVTQLGYLGLGVSDMDAWVNYAESILGLRALPRDADGSQLLRMDDHHHRFILEQDDADDLNLIGWEVADEQALIALGKRMEAAGVAYRFADNDALNRRRVVNLIEFEDPSGVASEAYCGPLIDRANPFQPTRPLSGFRAGEQGLGHVVMAVNNLDDTLAFYRDVIGLRMSDWIRPQPERGVESHMNIAFMHCNPRHHSLAFWQGEMPKRMHHFMLQVNALDDVGDTYYLCQRENVPIDLSLGRHTNDKMFSFYMKTPSGFDVEFGWGGIEIDDETWTVQLHTDGSSWGHLPAEPH
ncbi:MAG: VOC family protein [Gammaproteobacteria bacterium]|jgi:2,3-dihydroxybiphenyl 1,2-dioxygenase